MFTSERGSPFTTAGFARMVERAGVEAKLGFKAHPHMLRHACGFALANKGHDTRALQAYLGHRNIQHTVRYTELSPDRFAYLSISSLAWIVTAMASLTQLRIRRDARIGQFSRPQLPRSSPGRDIKQDLRVGFNQ